MEKNNVESIFHRAIQKKKLEFRHFSLRWMAKRLDVSHAYLSLIINGKRPVPLEKVEAICEILDLDHENRAQIYAETFRGLGYRPGTPSRTVRIYGWRLASVHNFDLISRWEPMAIMLMVRLRGFDGTAEYISRRTGFPNAFVQQILDLLCERGYLEKHNGKIRAEGRFWEFQSQSSKEDLRKYHRSVLAQAMKLMDTRTDTAALERRHIASGALYCSQEIAQKLKVKINEFMKECIEEGAVSSAEEVYQLAVQFFPVTEPESGREST